MSRTGARALVRTKVDMRGFGAKELLPRRLHSLQLAAVACAAFVRVVVVVAAVNVVDYAIPLKRPVCVCVSVCAVRL